MWAGLLNSCPADLQNMLNKGCVVLESWIPEVKDLPAFIDKGAVAMDHGWALEYRSPEGQKRAAELRAMIARARGESMAIEAKNQQIAALSQKLKDAEARVSRAK